MLIIFNIKEMKSCCCSCPCTDECPCKSPCDCSKCIWKIKIKSKKDITTNEYLLDGLLRTFIILPFRNSAWISGSSCLNENLFLRFLSFLLCSFLLSVPREVVSLSKGISVVSTESFILLSKCVSCIGNVLPHW